MSQLSNPESRQENNPCFVPGAQGLWSGTGDLGLVVEFSSSPGLFTLLLLLVWAESLNRLCVCVCVCVCVWPSQPFVCSVWLRDQCAHIYMCVTLGAQCTPVWLFVTPWTARLLCPSDFLGEKTGVGCRFLLHAVPLPGWKLTNFLISLPQLR